MLINFQAYQLAIQFFRLCEKVRGNRFLIDQLIRASSSIALNLAEGSEQGTPANRRRFYRMAMGSTRECQAILDLVGDDQRVQDAARIGDRVAGAIFALCKALDRQISPSPTGTEDGGLRTEDRPPP